MESHSNKPTYRPNNSDSKSFFDSMDSKTAFIVGFVASILVIGTIGFFILGGCMLKGSCTGTSTASADSAPTQVAVAPDDLAPNPAPIPTGAVPDVTDDDYVRGNPNAKVTMIEYSDFECPFCSRFAETTDEILDEYGDDIRFVYRHFPLSFHPEAEPAALAAECAGEQGKFWEFHDELFANQTSLGTKLYDEIADDLGINNSQFKDCIDTEKYAAKIRTQAQEGGAAGVSGTPGSFIIDADGNIEAVKGALPFSAVQPLIEAAL